MNSFLLHLHLAAILFAPAASLRAEAPPETRKISLSVCCLRYVQDAKSLMLRSNPGAEPSEIPLYQGGFGEAVPVVVEGGSVVAYRKTADVPPAWVPAWTISVPANGSSAKVILFPAAPTAKGKASFPYRCFVIPPETDFRFGSVLALNLTRMNARLDFGRKKLPLVPGGTGVAELRSEADSFDMVPITASIHNGREWMTLHTSRWPYNKRMRQISILWMDAKLKRPEITTIRDIQSAVE